MARRVKPRAKESPQVKPDRSLDMTFSVFFSQCVANGLVKHWQENEIHIFFKGLGLTDKEPQDKYKDALARY